MRFVFVFCMFFQVFELFGQNRSNHILKLESLDFSDGKTIPITDYFILRDKSEDSLRVVFSEHFLDNEDKFQSSIATLKLLGGSHHQKVMITFNVQIKRLLAIKSSEKAASSFLRTGSTVAPDQAAYRMSFVNALPIEIAAREEVVLLIKFPVNADQELLSEIKDYEQVDQRVNKRLIVSYIFTAILFTFAIYNLLLAFLVKRKVYYYYSYYIFSFGLYASLITLTLVFSRAIVAPLSIISASTMISVGALFSGEFLRIEKHLSGAVFYYKFLLYFVVGVGALLTSNYLFWNNTSLNNGLAIGAALVGLSTIPFWLWVGYRIHRKGSPRGRLFLLTNIPLLVGCCAFIAFWLSNHLGLIAATAHLAWVANLVLFGSVLFQLFLFSYVIGYSINKLQSEKLHIQQDINQQLEKQVQQRTASLSSANESIEDQRLELEELNRVKDNLFSIVSHDLRNPLNSVKSVLELMKRESLQGDELRLFAKKLEGSLDGTLNLLDNLLYWAKSQMDGIQAKPNLIQPKIIIENNLRLALTLFKEKAISVTTELNDEYAFADEDMIDLVVRNLLSNAIKFTPANGEITLKMSSRNGFLKFSLEDTGIGMSPKALNELFSNDKNHTSYGTNNEKGYGIGLTLCKDFIEINGGRLTIKSVENEGSVFTVSLPSN